jgi:hypothetical protein
VKFLIDVPPEECLNRAVAYMVGEVGCTIEHSNDYAVTFGHKPNIGGGIGNTILALDSAFSREKGVGSGQLLQTQALLVVKTTLVVFPTDSGGTRLLLGGTGEAAKLLYDWIRRELLNLSTQLLDAFSSGKQQVAVYNDRLELARETGTEDIMFDQVASLSVDQGWVSSTLTIETQDGQTIKLDKLERHRVQEIQSLIEESGL